MNKLIVSTSLVLIIISLGSVQSQGNQQHNCPGQFIQAGQCVGACGVNHIQVQGQNRCLRNNSSDCLRPQFLTAGYESLHLYCSISSNNDVLIVNKDGSCIGNGSLIDWVTGICHVRIEKNPENLQKLKGILISNANNDKQFLLPKSAIIEVIQQRKANQNYGDSIGLNLSELNCEVVDNEQNLCITKAECKIQNKVLHNNEMECDCILPKILSSNEKQCLSGCLGNQIITQIEGIQKSKCALGPKQTTNEMKLSSEKRRYVTDCLEIHEISCKQSNNDCVKKINLNGILNNQCPLTIQHQVSQIRQSQDLLFPEDTTQIQKSKFMETESKWALKKIEVDKLDLFEQIEALKALNTLSLELLAKQQNSDVAGEFQATSQNVSIFAKKIPAKQEKNITLKKDFVDITILSINDFLDQKLFTFTVFQQLCKDSTNCQQFQFVLTQKASEAVEDCDNNFEFKLGFLVDSKQIENDGVQAFCMKGNLDNQKELEFSIDTEHPFDKESTEKRIECTGSSFVGIYYGKSEETLKIIEKAEDNQVITQVRNTPPDTAPDTASDTAPDAAATQGLPLWVLITLISLGIVTTISLALVINMFVNQKRRV